MIKIAIVDDEIIAVNSIAKKVQDYFDDANQRCCISTFTSGKSMILDSKKEFYDLLFLDIDMPELTGFELAEELRKHNDYVTLIFITNKDELVFESFEFKPFAFIRKLNFEENIDHHLHRFIKEYTKKTRTLDFIVEGENLHVKIQDIQLLSSVRHDIFLLLTNGKSYRLATRKYTLNKLENELKNYGFMRVHKTYLINYREIYQFDESKIILADKKEIPVSRGRIAEIKNLYKVFMRSEIK